MAKTAMKIKQQRKQKFSTREYNRCKICGRPHAYLRKYGICRICFRELATKEKFRELRKQAGKTQTLLSHFSLPGDVWGVRLLSGTARRTP